MTEKYASVNGQWPDGTNDGRDVIPTPKEALAGAKRLYRKAFGRPFKGTMKLTSGRRHTYIRRGVFYVNPNEKRWAGSSINGGWHEIVHSISHYACARLHPNASGHGPQHAWIERTLIEHVVNSGWLEGKLKRPEKPKVEVDQRIVRAARVAASIKRWETKRKRDETALKKLRKQARYYERVAGGRLARTDLPDGTGRPSGLALSDAGAPAG